jgi:hypothetical protein
VEILYRQADWLLLDWVEGYVPLTEPQRSRLKADIAGLLAWGCREQLPALSDLLGELDRDAQAGRLTPERVRGFGMRVESMVDALLGRATPAAARLLADLSPAQLASLYRSLEEVYARDERRIRTASPGAVAEGYARTGRDHLKRWLGNLSPDQERILDDWAAGFRPLGTLGLGFRRDQGARLRPMIERCRHDPRRLELELKETIARLGERRKAEHRALLEHNRSITYGMVAAALSQADRGQLKHLHRYASGLRADLAVLDCGP